MGQCFSTTSDAFHVLDEEYMVIPDVKRPTYEPEIAKYVTYTFTDGCGFISSSFAKQIAETLDLEDYSPDMISAFQFRFKGSFFFFLPFFEFANQKN